MFQVVVIWNPMRMRILFKNRKTNGFTLVELLVVIGIVAILAGVSLSYLSSAMNRARTAKCSGNLRSIGVALLSFAADNDGSFPEAGGYITYGTVDKGGTGKPGWTEQLNPYIPTSVNPNQVYKCPDSSSLIPRNVKYAYFLGAHAGMAADHGYSAVSLLRTHAASQLILAGDIAFDSNLAEDDADKDDYTQDPAFNGNSGAIRIHQGTVNILFADGHIENLRKFDKDAITTRYDGPGYDYLSSP